MNSFAMCVTALTVLPDRCDTLMTREDGTAEWSELVQSV